MQLVDKRKLISDVESISAEYGDDNSSLIEQGDVLDLIEEAPTVDAIQVVRGHWEGDKYPICSVCRTYALSDKENLRVVDKCYEDISRRVKFYNDVYYDVVYHKTTFCPHCGAKMED